MYKKSEGSMFIIIIII